MNLTVRDCRLSAGQLVAPPENSLSARRQRRRVWAESSSGSASGAAAVQRQRQPGGLFKWRRSSKVEWGCSDIYQDVDWVVQFDAPQEPSAACAVVPPSETAVSRPCTGVLRTRTPMCTASAAPPGWAARARRCCCCGPRRRRTSSRCARRRSSRASPSPPRRPWRRRSRGWPWRTAP